MKKLSPRQKELLEHIARFIEQKSYPPSYQELADLMDIKSKYAVLKHIDALVEKGYLEKTLPPGP